MSKSILITGASGFIGSHLAIELADSNFSVVALGHTSLPPAIVQQRVARVSHGDLSNPAYARDILLDSRPDFIIHAAAWADAAGCETDKAKATRANVSATKNLVRECGNPALGKTPSFFYLSTDLVFDGSRAPAGGFLESDTANCRGVYAQSKLTAEQVVLSEHSDARIFRVSLVYGQKIEQRGGFMGWLRAQLESKKDTPVFIDEFRTPVYVKDIALAISGFIIGGFIEDDHGLRRKSSPQRIFHLGGPERLSRAQFAEEVVRHFGYDRNLLRPTSRLNFPSSMPRPEDVSLNSSLIWGQLGSKPRTLREALTEFV